MGVAAAADFMYIYIYIYGWWFQRPWKEMYSSLQIAIQYMG